MKLLSSKFLIPIILLSMSLVLIFITSESKGIEFIFDNIILIFICILLFAFAIFVKIREKTGKISEQQITKANNFSKSIKKRMTVFFICIIIAAIIAVVFDWYYSIPLFVVAIIIYSPILKKIYHGDYGDKTDKRKD